LTVGLGFKRHRADRQRRLNASKAAAAIAMRIMRDNDTRAACTPPRNKRRRSASAQTMRRKRRIGSSASAGSISLLL
jgi:hypothetical protein